MPNYLKTANGLCPYCNGNNYDDTKTEERKGNQDWMFCQNCSQWSVRGANGFQYPTDSPSDKEGYPSTKVSV